jgi:hypothetical protein
MPGLIVRAFAFNAGNAWLTFLLRHRKNAQRPENNAQGSLLKNHGFLMFDADMRQQLKKCTTLVEKCSTTSKNAQPVAETKLQAVCY